MTVSIQQDAREKNASLVHYQPGLSKTKQAIGLFGWLAISFIASGIGVLASIRADTFYAQLVQPSWAPPASVFGPVWTLLYAMMGVAAWLVWRAGGFRANQVALSLFLAQLAVNALWSWLFFAWHFGALAFADIVLLWLLVAATLASFWRVSTLAGALLIPYLLWISFASALNFSVWQLNPQVLGTGSNSANADQAFDSPARLTLQAEEKY